MKCYECYNHDYITTIATMTTATMTTKTTYVHNHKHHSATKHCNTTITINTNDYSHHNEML